MESWLPALIALTAMEIVLGIDNIVFIAILSGKLPIEQQAKARQLGLLAALVTRILLLFSITWVIGMVEPIFKLSDFGLPLEWFTDPQDEHFEEYNGISVRDLILIAGGLFLLWKSVHEIHDKIEGGHHEREVSGNVTFQSVLFQIALLDIVFSLDSVITAVGMAKQIWVMVTAVILAVCVMLAFSGQISRFVEKHPTVKMLALSFLMMIGVMLVADGFGTHINKGYIYFAMAFSLFVEFLNLTVQVKHEQRTHNQEPVS